ncbi:MAG: M23 family metallopeptidase [Anaerolineae bacterium]|jgi:murein DD-endopeptidase MepM/ murein hydrolase activator NlpD
MQRRRSLILLGLALVFLISLLVGRTLWRRYRYSLDPLPVPFLPTAPPYTPWPTPPVVDGFDFPLQPADGYAAYVQGITGPLPVDTRYGHQNPAMADNTNCFEDASGDPVPFSQLYHAGVDLFAIDAAGQAVWGKATHAPVHAVADGVVVFVQDAGSDGHIVISEHRLADGETVYSVYWHVDHVQVARGQPVDRGQVVAVVMDRGANSHLHWEIRTFRDGSELFPRGSAGARGRCNGHFAGVGYTWDDDPAQARPEAYGYFDPIAFVESHRPLD